MFEVVQEVPESTTPSERDKVATREGHVPQEGRLPLPILNGPTTPLRFLALVRIL